MTMPAPVVAAPEPRGLRYGLLTAATGPLDLPEVHGRASGLIYEPVSCGTARLYPPYGPDPNTHPDKTFDPADSFVQAVPLVVYATYKCGAAGHRGQDLVTKVQRRLANGEQGAVEQGLAAVLADDATDVVAPNPDSLVSVVGALEQWLYGEQGYGNQGYLHLPARLAARATQATLLYRDGPLWRLPMGTIVVFGGGYPDDGTVYITGNVTVWRAPDVMVPPVEQVLDRTTNQYFMLAEREYAVAFDCLAAGATFTGEVPAS